MGEIFANRGIVTCRIAFQLRALWYVPLKGAVFLFADQEVVFEAGGVDADGDLGGDVGVVGEVRRFGEGIGKGEALGAADAEVVVEGGEVLMGLDQGATSGLVVITGNYLINTFGISSYFF